MTTNPWTSEVTFLRQASHALAFHAWPDPSTPIKALVLLVHGLGEHMGRYGHVAQALHRAGYAVRGYDHVGHGRSEGKRGDIDQANRLVADAQAVLRHCIDAHPHWPVVVLGHSMGGLVVQRLASQSPEGLAGVIMSSPALQVLVNPVERLLLATLPRWWPHLRLDNGVKTHAVSRDPQVVRDYIADPLVHRKISAALAAWIVEEGQLARAQASSWRVPSLLLFAGQDRLVDPQGSRAFARAASSQVLQTHAYEEMFHEIFNDPEKDQVLQDLVNWLDGRFMASNQAQSN